MFVAVFNVCLMSDVQMLKLFTNLEGFILRKVRFFVILLKYLLYTNICNQKVWAHP